MRQKLKGNVFKSHGNLTTSETVTFHKKKKLLEPDKNIFPSHLP